MEDLGWWVFYNGVCMPVGFENGVLCIDKGRKIYKTRYYMYKGHNFYGDIRSINLKFKNMLGEKFFGDIKFLSYNNYDYVEEFIMRCVGKNRDEINEVVELYKKNREHSHHGVWKRKWAILREKFDGVVIGLDKDIDVYGEGFSVRVLFRSDIVFEERKKFLKNNRKEFLEWVMLEIPNNDRMAKKIGDIRFYKPVEIVNLRVPEVEVKFEVKGEVA